MDVGTLPIGHWQRVEVFCVAYASEEYVASIFRMTLKIETAPPKREDSQEENLPYICHRKTTEFASPPCLQMSTCKKYFNPYPANVENMVRS